MEKTIRCKVCTSEAFRCGLLERCLHPACGVMIWDKDAVVAVLRKNAETENDTLPDWMISLLSDACVPESVSGAYYVYVIRLTQNLPQNISVRKRKKLPNKGDGRFYVGMTGLHPFERYLNHIRGYKSSWVVKNLALAMETFDGPMSYQEAKALEPNLAEKLIEKGFDVHGGH